MNFLCLVECSVIVEVIVDLSTVVNKMAYSVLLFCSLPFCHSKTICTVITGYISIWLYEYSFTFTNVPF